MACLILTNSTCCENQQAGIVCLTSPNAIKCEVLWLCAYILRRWWAYCLSRVAAEAPLGSLGEDKAGVEAFQLSRLLKRSSMCRATAGESDVVPAWPNPRARGRQSENRGTLPPVESCRCRRCWPSRLAASGRVSHLAPRKISRRAPGESIKILTTATARPVFS